jgi:hypothetical protein
MGDAADAILNGDCCESCGVFFEESGDGFPRKCSGCRHEHRQLNQRGGKRG